MTRDELGAWRVARRQEEARKAARAYTHATLIFWFGMIVVLGLALLP